MRTYVGTIAHANGGDTESVYGIGIPPIWATEEPDLFLGRQFLDEVRDRRI